MKKATLYIASDHAGFDLKSHILGRWTNGVATPETNWILHDLGPSTNSRVDYPDFAHLLCKQLLLDVESGSVDSRGILICGSGQGMAMAANRHPGIRAALSWSEESALLGRSHNDANVLCLGSRLLPFDLADSMVEIFLQTSFEGGRHTDRVTKIEC